ncbi:MAG: choline BCCT transporter BetT [Trueperella pyogenes]|nr:choline BCCT transporter BetT [Trueperella pyogenes]MCI7690716.1 choline BCCT transporter BetT [Trueperella pyogenes]
MANFQTLRRESAQMKKVVFFGSAAAILAIALWAFVGAESAAGVLGAATSWIGRWFGWFYILMATVIVVFVLYVAISRYGHLRLGPANSRPEFSTFAWASMLFAAGIGTDIMFFAVAEPISQYMAPPQVAARSIEAAEQATVWTIFHYGLTGWGMYALMGMILGYFSYRHGKRLAVRSALEPVFGKRVHGPLGDVVDIAAVLGTVFGVATTLGIGVVQISVGLELIFGIKQGLPAQVGLIVAAVVLAAVSAVSGVARGIRILSQLNVLLAILTAAWVLIGGRTHVLLNAIVMNVGDLLAMFPGMTLDTMAFSDAEEWKGWWTLFFWAWWVAWASFVGMFLARISRGRTLRQFIVGCMTVPFLYVVMWISIFGNAALDRVIHGDDLAFAERTLEAPELGLYSLLQDMPGSGVLMLIATFVAFLFYVTSADSGALVMANLSSNLPTPRTDARPWLRIFWAAVTGVLTVAMLVVGGIPALQSATVIMGLPFAVVMVAAMIGFYRTIYRDVRRRDSQLASERYAVAGGGVGGSAGQAASWRERLATIFGQVSPVQASGYLDRVVQPALEALAAEMTAQGMPAEVVRADHELIDGMDPEALIYDRVKFAIAGEEPFVYRVVAVDAPAVVYGGRFSEDEDRSVRLEVHTSAGGQDYDVMGYSGEAIIHDLLDHFDYYQAQLRSGRTAF